MDKQYYLQKDFFFNWLITDFEPSTMRLSDSWRRRRARPKQESAWCFKRIFNKGSWVSIRSNGIGVEEKHPLKTLLAVQWEISNWLVRYINLLQFLVTLIQNSGDTLNMCFVCVLVKSARVCDSGWSSFTICETFTMAHFVVKPTLQSNRPIKFKSSIRSLRRLAKLGKEAPFFKKLVDDANIETADNSCMS